MTRTRKSERGTRNAERQGIAGRRGLRLRANPVMMFRVPTSAFRLLSAFWRLNVAEELQYRANFVASLLGTVFYMATALLTLALFFHHTTALGGWDYWEIVVLLGVFNALTGVIEAVLRPGIGQLAGEVRSGELDLVLVKPVDPQGFVSFRRLDIWRFTDVVLGLALAGYALFKLGRVPSVAQLAAFVLALGSAAVVVYAIWVLLMSLAFWFVSVENIAVLFDAVYEGARYPVSAYPGALRFLFVYLIPIAWTTTIPASALTGRLRPEIALVAALVAALAFALARALWRAALKRYAGASG
jgi:ABC-2 type transport system permease protein